jgi:hypothetical protein
MMQPERPTPGAGKVVVGNHTGDKLMHFFRLSRCAVTLAGLLGIGTVGSTAVAQGTNAAGRIPIPYRTYIGINPLGIPFDIFSIEVESGIAQGMTLGVSAAHTEIDNARYSSADLKFRYYPSEIVLKGFSIGASAGLLRYSDIRSEFDFSATQTRQTIDTPTLGLLIDYNWMLGASHRFIVGTGISAKRILAGSEDRDKVGLDRALPSARFTVGVAF